MCVRVCRHTEHTHNVQCMQRGHNLVYLSRLTVELMSLLTFDTSFSSVSAKKKGPSHHSSLLQRLALLAVERTASSKCCCCCFSLHCWLHKTGTNFYVDSFNATPIILTWPLWSPLAILKVTLMEQPVSCWGFSLSLTHAGQIQLQKTKKKGAINVVFFFFFLGKLKRAAWSSSQNVSLSSGQSNWSP